MVRLQKCCCCSLQAGALVIGYLNIVSVGFSMASTIVQLVTPPHLDEQVKTILAVTLTICCLALLVNLLMVYGVHQGKPGYLIAWLALKFLYLLVATVFLVILCGQLLMSEAEAFQLVIVLVLYPLILGLAWYLYLVVYSHYKELCDGPNHSRLENKSYNYSDDQLVIVSEK